MAKDSTIIPMPPSQWVRLLQKSNPRGTISMLIKTEAPVVVNPETDSKKASAKVLNTPPQ